MSAPHLLHLTRFGALIFQFALLLSLLDFEDLFFGQIDIFTPPPCTHVKYYKKSSFKCQGFIAYISEISLLDSLAIASSSLVGITLTLTLDSGLEISISLPTASLFFSLSITIPR